jgi:5'-methylthioadenosine phosphorylase
VSGPRRTIGLIGGSGITEFLEGETVSHRVATPWGPPSGPIIEGTVGPAKVLFLGRHGPGHTIPPHRVNYRANVDALRSLGAEAIITVSSVGSTKQRPTTFFEGGRVYHVSTADPFCPDLTRRAVSSGHATGVEFHEGKTYVCVEGPRFSTRAESRYFREFADVIGMTLVPEVTLARERAICYLCLAMVTDFDVWSERPVEAKEIVETMHRNARSMHSVLGKLIPSVVQNAPDCRCARALDEAAL